MTRSVLGSGWGVRAVAATVAVAVCLSGVAVAGPPTGGALPPQLTQVVGVAGVGEVPIDAVGVALNVTVTNPAAAGFVTVHPCSATLPVASNVNYVRDQTVPNLVVSGLDADGDVCIDTLAVTDLVVDVAGYIPAGSPVQPLAAPVRFLDTREGIGAPKARVAAGQVLQVPVAGTPGVPAGAGTVIFNTTVVSPTTGGFATVFPCGQPIPATSTVNFVAGAIVPNLTITGVGAGGAVCVFSTAETDLVADVAAFVPAGASGITMLPSPQRILDTRIGLGGPDLPIGGAVRSLQVTGVVGVPASASAALVNLTATEGTGAGFAAAFPCGVGVPLVSNLNFAVDQNVANAAIVKLAADGTMCLTSNVSVDMVVDVTGYVSGTTAMVPITPSRLLDTREDVVPLCDVMITSGLDGPMRWFDLRTATSGSHIPIEVATSLFWIQLASDCASMWAVVGVRDLVEVDRNGVVLSRRPIAPGVSMLNLVMTDFGPFSTTNSPSGPRLVEPTSGDVVFDFRSLDGSRFWNLAGVARDLSRFYFYTRMPDSTLQFHVVDGNDDLLAIFTAPAGSDYFSVSPSGLYLSYGIRVMTGGSERVAEVRVVTAAGDLVETRPTEIDGRIYARNVPWTGDGISIQCSVRLPRYDSPRLVRWDLFGTPQPLDPSLPCARVML